MIRIAVTAQAFDAIAAALPLGSVGFEREPDKTYLLFAPNVSSRSLTDHIGLHVIGRSGGLTGPLTGPSGGRRRIVHRQADCAWTRDAAAAHDHHSSIAVCATDPRPTAALSVAMVLFQRARGGLHLSPRASTLPRGEAARP